MAPYQRRICLLATLSLFVSQIEGEFGGRLGSSCEVDQDCTTSHSRCNGQGVCTCQPYHAQHNGHCLQAQLLGFGCSTSGQCTMKVANSTCAGGVCRCSKGFVQFRRHTCLPPAKLGQVCYSDSHCKMWNSNTRCQFLIPNLFGKCACKRPLHRADDGTCTAHNQKYHQHDHKHHLQNYKPQLSGTTANLLVNARPFASPLADPLGSHRGEEVSGGGALSLGMSCRWHEQCRRADPNSVCYRGRCDCPPPPVANTTRPSCSADNRGCHKATFQCRSSGRCISWYLVCDGREDCDDGSDEECGRGGAGRVRCPISSFACRRSGALSPMCVSAAARCNGVPDCPAAEDELNCSDTANRGCPRGTYRCSEGKCLPGYEFCNAIVSCPDGSDERAPSCTVAASATSYCPFRCRNGLCRSTAIACSGRDGCGDNSDETHCLVCRCPAS